jgi:hypothetical protein
MPTRNPSIKLALAVCILGLFTGCASLIDEDTQELKIAMMCKGKPVFAHCFAENGKGRWVFQSPDTVLVHNDSSALSITCKQQFHPAFTVSAPAAPSWAMASNLLIGGIVGAAYDVHTNKGLKYPDTITIDSPVCNK